MSKLSHKQARAWIFSARPLSEIQQQELQAHLAGCDQCRETAELHAALQRELPAAFPSPEQTRAKEQARLAAVQSALGRQRMIQRVATPVRWAAGALVIMLAAALLGWALRNLPPLPAAPEQATSTSPSRLSGLVPYPEPTATICSFNPSFGGRYIVQEGDILPGIAQTFGVSVDSLVRGNCLSSPEIFVDQVLRVPGPKATSPPYPAPTSQPSVSPLPTATNCAPNPDYSARYIVQAGDTLYSIARQYGISVQQLQSANCLVSVVIRPGQILRLSAAASQPLQPLTTGLQINIAGWSPDGQWLAFWLAEAKENLAALPYYPAELQFYDRQTASLCSVPELVAPGNTPVYWTEDGHLAVSVEAGAFGGLPCQPLAPMTDEQYQIIASQAAPDPRLSPDRTYRAETTRLADEQGMWRLQTVISAAADNTLIYQFDWQRYAALGDLGLGGGWITDELLLMTTDISRGPLLVDLRGLPESEPRLIEVAGDLFGVPGVVESDPDNYTGLVAYGAPHPTADGEFHLLLAGTGIEAQFPPVRLYHSENSQIEELPYAYFDGFRPDSGWLLLVSRDNSSGFEAVNYWSRAVEAQGSAFTRLAAGGYIYFAPDGEQYLHAGAGLPLEQRSFPDTGLLNSWEFSPNQSGSVVWSPDSRIAAVVGFNDLPEGQRSGLFLLQP